MGTARDIRPGQIELGKDHRKPAFDVSGITSGVLGLDRQPDLAPTAHHDVDQPAKCQELVPLMVQVGHLHLAVVSQLPGTEVQTLERGQLERGDQTLPVRGPADIAVMGTDQMGVGCEPHVALERVGALVDSAQVGLERVLWQVPAGSPVGDDLGDRPGDWHGCFVHEVIVAPQAPEPPGDTLWLRPTQYGTSQDRIAPRMDTVMTITPHAHAHTLSPPIVQLL